MLLLMTVLRSFGIKKDALRLLVEREVRGTKVQIKIELSPVLRRTVYESTVLNVTEAVENEFGFAEISVVSFADLYEGEFKSMVDNDVPLAELVAAREEIVARMHAAFTDEEKAFLLTFKSRKPDWSLLGLANVQQLPAVRWKLNNLEKMSEERHRIAYNKLKEALSS